MRLFGFCNPTEKVPAGIAFASIFVVMKYVGFMLRILNYKLFLRRKSMIFFIFFISSSIENGGCDVMSNDFILDFK